MNKEFLKVDQDFPLKKGWALKENLKLVKTIKGWIGRYSADFKKEALERGMCNSC
ncbi:hypothetical protein C1645_833002 [Glomus cerebriforme]|uniref:Uncharacterized protein n=1 Tax=Glomus cerebriforme TaxID=658196 RepID=A0A397SEI4_9GLOM|nr:hypothetical protein C1645_833002 [Glomus cerebriforme]